jgi:hypothetical protein
MSNRCIFLISARDNLLPICLSNLDRNYNSIRNYPIVIFYHGDRYDDENYRQRIRDINPKTEYRFHTITPEIPSHLEERDLFWNLNNDYARNFRGRLGYLHANYFWNNFMNFPELNEFDYLMRIDDDSWFKETLDFDFFDELDDRNGMFGTGFTWNHFSPSHLHTRHNLFNWIKYYVEKYNVDIKNQQLKDSLDGPIDNELFHTLKWNCGNCNVYNREMFNTQTWKTYLEEFNDIAGGYRYRWGDCEVIGLYAYMHLDNPLIDFDLRNKNLYSPQLPNTTYVIT